MPTAIKQIKDSSNTVHDLDNRYITLTATSGTLTTDQLAILQSSNQNYIVYGSYIYRLVSGNSSALYYQRIAAETNKNQYFTITVSSRAYVYTDTQLSTTDTKNTAGSTDTSSKIFLVGATSQAANPQTYSDNQVYATNGQLDANKVRIAEAVTLVYDSTNKCINFNFS